MPSLALAGEWLASHIEEAVMRALGMALLCIPRAEIHCDGGMVNPKYKGGAVLENDFDSG
jgi:hypothetical protein